MSKHAAVSLYQFDCLPGHVQIEAGGTASNIRAATKKAIDRALRHKILAKRRIGSFRMTVILSTAPKKASE